MSGGLAVHFKSERADWGTPPDLFARLNDIYSFDLDAAATAANALCAAYYTPETDGLAQSWAGRRVWCNPPYGRKIGLWIQKAVAEAAHAKLIVMLAPARTDTLWWHAALPTARPVYLKGRLRFVGASSSAPFPSALLLWNCP